MTKITIKENFDIEAQGFKLHKTGMEVVGNPTFDEWEDVGKFIRKSSRAVQWWFGDWANYGEGAYREKYSQALEESDYERETLHNIGWVCREIEPSRRREVVPFSVYQDIAPLSEKEQDEILDMYDDFGGPTRQEVRTIVRENKALNDGKTLPDRPITPYGDNIYYVSTKWQDSREDSYKKIKEGKPYPTLKRRSWFYHEDDREFSLREYAQVQDFPDTYKFVGTYEKIKDQIGNAVSPKMAKHVGKKLKGKTFGDVFAGCGGLSCGLEMAGKEARWAIERDPKYLVTYEVNHPDTLLISRDIRKVKPASLEKVDIIVGGPPCQGFSLSGMRFKDDPRNEMYKEFVRFVKGLQPKEFLMENVPQVQQIESEIIEDFAKLGYEVEGFLVRGEDIGMRQHRNRYFFYGHN